MTKPLSVRNYYQHNQRKVKVVFTITFLSIFLQCALLIYTTSMLDLYQGVSLEYFKSVTYINTLNATREYRRDLINLLNKQSTVAKVIPFMTISTSISGVGEASLICIKPQEIKSLMQMCPNVARARTLKWSNHFLSGSIIVIIKDGSASF